MPHNEEITQVIASPRVGRQARIVEGSTKEPCLKCGAICWTAPSSKRLMALKGINGIHCFECAVELAKASYLDGNEPPVIKGVAQTLKED